MNIFLDLLVIEIYGNRSINLLLNTIILVSSVELNRNHARVQFILKVENKI